MTTDALPQTITKAKPDLVCPKCNEKGKYIIAHEDGWQCWNCMKIIYKNTPINDLDISS